MKGVVAIVGRPNVGKSTLFNRLAGRRAAIVEDVPGVTRDRHYTDAEWGGRTFTLVDTGGFIPDEKEPLHRQVREQAQLAVEEADVILLVVDGKAGLTAADQEVAAHLRKSGKPTLLVVNKIDSPAQASQAAEFYRLGFEKLFDISAEHDRNVEALVEAMLEKLGPAEEEAREEEGERPIRVAIVGRPNVGKSTLVNSLLGEERLIVSPVAGTTRDPIDTELEYGGRKFILTDTAGIRRKSTIAQRVERYSVVAALKAIERSDVAVLVLDATEPGVDQDAKLAALAEARGRALLLVVNKWDLVKDRAEEAYFREWLKQKLAFISWAPVLFVSAKEGQRLTKVLDVAADLHAQTGFRARTPQLNKLLEHVTTEHPAPYARGKPIRLYYVAQVGTAPPSFAFTCNMPEEVPERYKRYLANQLRETFRLKVPIRLFFRERPARRARRAEKRRFRTGRTATRA